MPRLVATQGFAGIQGFRAMGVRAGLKKERPDIAIIVSDVEGTQAAGVFTQNAFAAAPVHITRQHVADGTAQAIVVNSGNANACTGRQGLRDALDMAKVTAQHLGLAPEQILVCSTGRIGVPMPMDKVRSGIADCVARLGDATGAEVSQAILTTDTGPKEARATFTADGKTCTIAGIAKGAGMIHPNMATMLAFLVTDANVPGRHLNTALSSATAASFNQISVDGDESTNDTALILANGAAGNGPLSPDHSDWASFQGALTEVCTKLAKSIAADGEGATKLLEVRVLSAADVQDARLAARAIAASNLVKAAIHGSDPNWGRIVAAAGSIHFPIDTSRVSVRVGDRRRTVPVLEDGEVVDNQAEARELLRSPEVVIELDLDAGPHQGTAWGCDLTTEYVTFNAEYTT